ncbi:MAG: YgeY family selenium metabolism-linked hydrolase [Staphylothermus sp.]|nr:YgeY family selenium metabolism-linked hydrolase [Staphylothermus sp.]
MSGGGKVVEFASELIRVKSLSGEEKEVAYTIRDLLSSVGVNKVFIDEYGSVVGMIKGGIDKVLVFEGHMDHVPEGDRSQWIIEPYKPTVIDGKLYGRGSVDMKGAIASMISSITKLGESKDLPTIYYVFVPFEEISEGTVFKYTIDESLKIKPDLVVLGEATNLNLHIGQRGRTVLRIILKGRSAHASMPSNAVNPLIGTCTFIRRVSETEFPVHDVLGQSTFSPTIIDCEPKSTPMIPDTCELVIDYRFVVGETKEDILKRMQSILEELSKEGSILGYSIGINRGRATMWTGKTINYEDFYPAWIMDRDSLLIKKAYSALKKHVAESIIGVWRFSTDGVYSAGMASIPTIGIGPGDENLAHMPNEYVPVKHLLLAEEIYADIAKNVFKLDIDR